MTIFGTLRDKLQRAYARHSQLYDAIARFLLSAGMCIMIREAVPFHPLISHPLFLLAVSALTAFLPWPFLPLSGAILITGEAFALDLTAGGVTLAVLLILFLLFLRFVPEDSVAAVLTPMAMYFGFDTFIPICCGLRRSPVSVFAVCPGAVVYALLHTLSVEAETVRTMGDTDIPGKLRLLISGTFTDTLAVALLAMAACLVTVNAVRNLSADYAPHLAVLLGSLVYLFFLLLGRLTVLTEIALQPVLVGTAASAAAAYLLLLVWMPLQYAKSEYLRFEDEDYYYYVKAIPKARGALFPGESASFREVPDDAEDRH